MYWLKNVVYFKVYYYYFLVILIINSGISIINNLKRNNTVQISFEM